MFDDEKYKNFKTWFMRAFGEIIAQSDDDGSQEYFDALVNSLEDCLNDLEKSS